MRRLIVYAVLGACLAGADGRAETQITRLLAAYGKVQTVSCSVRRTVESDGRRVEFLSRVFYERPDRLNVENISPVRRRIVSDGTTFFSYADGDPKGFSRPVDELPSPMLISLRRLPGTAMDHLLRLEDAQETSLPAAAPYAHRYSYPAGTNVLVLSCDDQLRPARIDVYASASLAERVASFAYSDFREVIEGVWVPFRHEARISLGDVTSTETTVIDQYHVNEPLAEGLFVAKPYFSDVVFVDDFKKIYGD
jgi:hypothetical protein